MKRYLYLDGACGISGDMSVAALLDLGASKEKLDKAIKSMNLKGVDYEISEKETYSIKGCDFDVILEDEYEHPHHHAHHEHAHHHAHHEHDHYHAHHEHDHHHAHHEHRNLTDVFAIIETAQITNNAKNLAKNIFEIIAQAESKAHGCHINEVHFHEVGALDSILDIVSFAVLFDDLNLQECIITGLCEGSGFVQCQHGLLPVPVPAVLNIAQSYQIPLCPTQTKAEMITPTGIAIAAAIKTKEELPPLYKIEKIGIGLGKKDFGQANLLRAMIITEKAEQIKQDVKQQDNIYTLESNIDDSTGEELGFLMELLMQNGARDVHFIPCFMKKNRPAYLLRVIVCEENLLKIEKLIFAHTTTIGMRKTKVDRTCMARQMLEVEVQGVKIAVKKCTFEDLVRFYPEYESVKKGALDLNEPFKTVFKKAELACLEIK